MVTRKRLSEEEVVELIKNWDEKSPDQLANDLDVSVNTIIKMAAEINKINSDKCKPKKPKGRLKRSDIARAALKLLDEEGIVKL